MLFRSGVQEIQVEIPYEELPDYGTVLRSLTAGFGDYSYEFLRYEPASKEITEREVENAKTQEANS